MPQKIRPHHAEDRAQTNQFVHSGTFLSITLLLSDLALAYEIVMNLSAPRNISQMVACSVGVNYAPNRFRPAEATDRVLGRLGRVSSRDQSAVWVTALRAAVALTPDITLASQALGAVHAYVLGSVAAQQALRRAEQRTGLSEEEWQRSVGPYISEVLAAGEHPMLARRVLEAEELDPDVEFAFGLDCVLDGLAARLGR